MANRWGENENMTLFSWAPKSLQMVTIAMKLKDPCSLEEKLWPTSTPYKKQRRYIANKGLSSQSYAFSSSHVWMWELDYERKLSTEELMLLNCGVGEDSWESRGLQHARLPCPSSTPGGYSNSCPSSQWCHPTISSSSSPSPAFKLSQHPDLFQRVSS